jgi:hypothetical protein
MLDIHLFHSIFQVFWRDEQQPSHEQNEQPAATAAAAWNQGARRIQGDDGIKDKSICADAEVNAGILARIQGPAELTDRMFK